MTNILEKSAKTKEEAIELALSELGISMEEAEIEVVDEGSKGFLGIGGRDAVVKVSYTDSSEKRAQKFLDGLFEILGEEVTVDIKKDNKDLDVELSGPDMGVVIGKRGETLDALQHLTSLVVNRGDLDFVKVSIDTENYREKRVKALENLANKLANKVVRTGRNTSLEPMNAYERRIIHSSLQDHAQVTTYSVGQGTRRKVVIALKKD
ncbi:MAG: protein jag [Clostridia bacterium]|nr:protein jag [Clostridia bacterium]